MEFNSSIVFQNCTINHKQTWPGSSFVDTFSLNSVLVFLSAVFVTLFALVLKQRNITKLSDLTKNPFAKKSTGIPSVSMWTLLKSLYWLGKDPRSIAETVLAEKGGIVQVNFFGLYNFAFITNPSMAQKLYMSNEKGHLYKPNWYSKGFIGPLKEGLIASTPDIWKIHRSAILKSFSYNGLRRQLRIFEEHAKRFVLILQETTMLSTCASEKNLTFDKQVSKLTFEIISHIAAGKEMDIISEETKARFQDIFERTEKIVVNRFNSPINMFDFVWKLNPLKKEVDKGLAEMTGFVNELILETRKKFTTSSTDSVTLDDDMAGKSLFEVMLKAGFSNEEIFTETATLHFAGHDTTNNSFKMLMFLLAKHKNYQQKCLNEIDKMFDQMGDSQEISMEAINSLEYLDMCIKECLRIYPLVPILGRELRTPIQLDANTCLPSNTHVITFPLLIHNNPTIYPEPEIFNPERFLPENIKKRGMCDYMPFSVGPRNCIGFKSAMIELKVLAAYVLHNFEVSSEMTIDNVNKAIRKLYFPFPDFGIKLRSRQ